MLALGIILNFRGCINYLTLNIMNLNLNLGSQQLVNWMWNNLQLANKLDWFPMMTNYQEGLKYKILSQSFIDKMKRDPNVDFGQEYNTQFTSVKSAAFGSLLEENYLPEDEHSEDLTNLLN